MPNVPPKFQGGAGVKSLDARTNAGNGGVGTSDNSLYKVLPGYGRNCVTSGKPHPELKDVVSHGGQPPKAV